MFNESNNTRLEVDEEQGVCENFDFAEVQINKNSKKQNSNNYNKTLYQAGNKTLYQTDFKVASQTNVQTTDLAVFRDKQPNFKANQTGAKIEISGKDDLKIVANPIAFDKANVGVIYNPHLKKASARTMAVIPHKYNVNYYTSKIGHLILDSYNHTGFISLQWSKYNIRNHDKTLELFSASVFVASLEGEVTRLLNGYLSISGQLSAAEFSFTSGNLTNNIGNINKAIRDFVFIGMNPSFHLWANLKIIDVANFQIGPMVLIKIHFKFLNVNKTFSNQISALQRGDELNKFMDSRLYIGADHYYIGGSARLIAGIKMFRLDLLFGMQNITLNLAVS